MINLHQVILKPLLIAVFLCLAAPNPLLAATNILYLNSTRGDGTGDRGDFRHLIADTLDNYQDGTIFDVDFVQKHVAGDLASFLDSNPIDFYDQIWFDTSFREKTLLNNLDLIALNAWAANNQPEFILDSSFYRRNTSENTSTSSGEAMTINQALALQEAGGGIFIGTDHDVFAKTANQILDNFGFDSFFTGKFDITSNASFVGDLLLQPETVGDDFFVNHLQPLTTSNVPIGTHVLNANGGDRTIEIFENLFSFNPDKVVHIGTSFDTPIDDPQPVPEPNTIFSIGLVLGLGALLQRKKK